mgnify:CR=1 FL=1
MMQLELLLHKERVNVARDNALQKICRIMQKQTQDDIKNLRTDIARIEKIMLTSAGVLITGMAGVILVLITKVW